MPPTPHPPPDPDLKSEKGNEVNSEEEAVTERTEDVGINRKKCQVSFDLSPETLSSPGLILDLVLVVFSLDLRHKFSLCITLV